MQTYMLLIHCWALLIMKVASVCIQYTYTYVIII